MYFKKLELIGFKSFCDKTTLDFERGITAVVGPNGCGKSNIFDSIRWVLGEQSAKSLRGSDMLDVIFNGTDNKEPLGMAEVSLTFDNSSRFFKLDQPEIVVTRRLFRSGESEYMLNKATVRLKDIMDLLLGTGIGAESYSIVAQGKIDLVLSARPEERRQVFDEASGITKYKAQKRETMRRLEETQQNLLRVNDIVAEVKRQISSLERQANKARKYKDVFEELKLKETDLAGLERRLLLEQKEQGLKQLAGLKEQETALMEQLRQQEARISNRQSQLKSYEDSMMEIKGELLGLNNILVRNNEHIVFNRERATELEKSGGSVESRIVQAKAKLAQDEEKLNKLKEEYDGIKGAVEEKKTMLAAKEKEIGELGLRIKSSLAAIAEAKKAILETTSRVSCIKNEIGDFHSREQVFLARRKRLEIEKAKVFEEKAISEESLRKVGAELTQAKSAVEELNSRIGDVNSRTQDENRNLGVIANEMSEVEKERLTLVSHKEFLEKLKTKYEDIGESLSALIYLDKLPAEELSGLVIKVRAVDASDGQDKFSSGGQAGFKLTGEAKPIELDTRRIEEKILKLDEALGELRNKKVLRETCISELGRISEALKQDLRNQEISLANKESAYGGIQEQFNKIKEEEDIIVLELSDVQREISVLEGNLSDAQARLAALSNELRQKEDFILEEEDNISLNGKSREELLVAITQAKTEIEALNKRVAYDESTLHTLQESLFQDKDSLLSMERQAAESLKRIELLNQEVAECRSNIEKAQNEIGIKTEELKQAEYKYNEISGSTVEAVKKIEQDRQQIDALKVSLHELEMQDKELDYRYSGLKERILSAYKIDIDAQAAADKELDRQALGNEISGLKEKLDSYGAVNLVAIEEYDELKQRYDFLTQQQNDLLSARESLHQAILKINRTTKQMFMETFEKVKVEFRNYFRLLFNGGDAQVFLVDEQDPLESGIEIICRPPGKKLQNVLLLSGGEKTMSAIALIFAIFKVKPSPFCILDEIDAALDEANVDRFSRILQEFARESQFIVITHNKRTIVNANVMYGITMQQSGISKIVSVKFSQNKEKEALVEPAVA